MTNTDVLLAYHVPGGGGVLLISSEGDDRMGAKIKTPKKSLWRPTKPTHPWTKN